MGGEGGEGWKMAGAEGGRLWKGWIDTRALVAEGWGGGRWLGAFACVSTAQRPRHCVGREAVSTGEMLHSCKGSEGPFLHAVPTSRATRGRTRR